MWVPFWTLFKKEVIRFLKVWMHTVLAPVLTGGLYLFVFGEALSSPSTCPFMRACPIRPSSFRASS